MKNVVFDLGGVVVDWNPQRLLKEYPGDQALPVSLFEKGFFQEYWVDFDRGTVSQEKNGGGNEPFFSSSVSGVLGFCGVYQTFAERYSKNGQPHQKAFGGGV